MSSTKTQNIDHRDLKAKYNIFFFFFYWDFEREFGDDHRIQASKLTSRLQFVSQFKPKNDKFYLSHLASKAQHDVIT